MDHNPFLKKGQPGGRGGVEQRVNIAWQHRAAAPDEFENRLIDALEQIEVEGSGDPATIVIGWDQDRRVLLQIDADEKRGVPAKEPRRIGEEVFRIGLSEVADSRAREEAELARAPRGNWQGTGLGEVGNQWPDGKTVMLL